MDGFLRDVLWAQYCLFLFARLRDDVFDRRASLPSLVLAADMLLLEAQSALAKHFRRNAFWRDYHHLLTTSLRAAVQVDELQRRPGRMNAGALAVYARLSAILKVGAAAACRKFGRTSAIPRIGRFADGIAVAAQIVDDLIDIEEDCRRGRLNFAANTLLFRDRVLSHRVTARTLGRIARNLAAGRGLDAVFREARRHLLRARAVVRPLHLRSAIGFVDGLHRSLSDTEQHFQRARFAYLLRRL